MFNKVSAFRVAVGVLFLVELMSVEPPLHLADLRDIKSWWVRSTCRQWQFQLIFIMMLSARFFMCGTRPEHPFLVVHVVLSRFLCSDNRHKHLRALTTVLREESTRGVPFLDDFFRQESDANDELLSESRVKSG